MQQNISDFDREFERAIATYADPSDAGHPPVLAARVAAEVDARNWKRRWWLGMTIVVPVLGCLFITAVLYMRHPQIRHETADRISIPSSPNPAIAPRTSSWPKLEVTQRRIPHHNPRQLPKLDQFPIPSAPTEQEQLLMQFTTHASPKAQQLVAKARTQPDESLRIAELSIPYLDLGTRH